MIVSWISAGASSAVATDIAINNGTVDKLIYIDVKDQHEDSMRFVNDLSAKWGREIEILMSPYKNVENACLAFGKGYITGNGVSRCTDTLKKRVRKQWERENKGEHSYIWGIDVTEKNRCFAIEKASQPHSSIFPLVEMNLSKVDVHGYLERMGITRPKMYDLGYHNNNCIGCVRGGMGYWNKIRVDFPDVFASRASLERKVGQSCIKGVFLDELDPNAGRHEPPITVECGIMCELSIIEGASK